jgi:hypothetical protein
MGVNRVALLLPKVHLGMCMRPAEEVQAAHWPSNHVAEHPVGFEMCLAIQLKSFGKVFDAYASVSVRNPWYGTFKQGWRRAAIISGDVPRDCGPQ